MSTTPSLKPVQPDRQTREQIAQMTIRCVQRASARLKGESAPALEPAAPDRRVDLKESIQ